MAVAKGTAVQAALRFPAPQASTAAALAVGQGGIFLDADGDWVQLLGSINGGVQLGQPSAVAGTGIRIGASRSIFRNSPTGAIAMAGGLTATVTQILEGGIFTGTGTTTLTLPTAQGASGLVQALPGAQVGDLIAIIIAQNHATQTCTFTAGTGHTIFGIATNTNGNRIWYGLVTAVTANSETMTWY